MFIKLTEFVKADTTRFVYVNPSHITHLFEWIKPCFRQVENEGRTTSERYDQQVTCICFAVGLHEESDSINVLESLGEIMKEIN